MDASDCKADAYRLLSRNAIGFDRILSVDIDSILFIDPQKRPMTAWLSATDHGVRVFVAAGFPAERPGWATPAAVGV